MWNSLSSEQLRRLNRMLTYAFDEVPYYHRVLKNYSFDGHFTEEEFRRLPLLSKGTIQAEWTSFIASTADKRLLHYTWTSGSTGRPLHIARTRQEEVVALRYLMKERIRAGLTLPGRVALIGDRTAYLSGRSEGLDHGRKSDSDVLLISSIRATPHVVRDICTTLVDFQPTWLYCLPSVASAVAQHTAGYRLPLTALQLVELAGECVEGSDLTTIESTFGRVARGQYGCQEIWGIAYECEHHYYHIFDDHVIVEVLREDGQPAKVGDVGQAVITGLNQYTMPFVRYKLDDLLMPLEDNCPCERPGHRIQVVAGRANERIVGVEQSGTVVFEGVMQYLSIVTRTEVKQFQVVQRGLLDFDVFINCSIGWGMVQQRLFCQASRRALGLEEARFHFTVDSRQDPTTNLGQKPFYSRLRTTDEVDNAVSIEDKG